MLGQAAKGGPASDTFLTTTQAIANLGGGSFTGSTINFTPSGLAPSYDAQIIASGGSTINGAGVLTVTAESTVFDTYDGTEQLVVGSSPDATAGI